jgi:hypothetical protein
MSVHLLSGFSTLSVNAGGGTFDKDLGIGLEIRQQTNIEWNSLNSMIDFYYQGRVGSNYGSFPLSRAGGGLFYYPFGLPLHTIVMDNGATLSQNHFAPFVLGQLGLSILSITDNSDEAAGPKPFNGLTVGYQIGGGAELPLSQSISILVEFQMEGTLAGGSSSTSSTNSSLSYFAVNGLLGLSIRP